MKSEEYVPQGGEYVVNAPTGRWFVLKDLTALEQMAADDAANNPMRSIYFRFAAAIVRADGVELSPQDQTIEKRFLTPFELEARIDSLMGEEINALERAYDDHANPEKRSVPSFTYDPAPNEVAIASPTGRWFVLKDLTAREQMAADEVAGFGGRQIYYRTAMRIVRIDGVEVDRPLEKKDLDERLKRLMGEDIDTLTLGYNRRAESPANLKNSSTASESLQPA